MNHRQTDDSESRFAGYVEGLASVIGHKDLIGMAGDALEFGHDPLKITRGQGE